MYRGPQYVKFCPMWLGPCQIGPCQIPALCRAPLGPPAVMRQNFLEKTRPGRARRLRVPHDDRRPAFTSDRRPDCELPLAEHHKGLRPKRRDAMSASARARRAKRCDGTLVNYERSGRRPRRLVSNSEGGSGPPVKFQLCKVPVKFRRQLGPLPTPPDPVPQTPRPDSLSLVSALTLSSLTQSCF